MEIINNLGIKTVMYFNYNVLKVPSRSVKWKSGKV